MKLMRALGKGKRVLSLVTLGVMAALLLLPLTLVFEPSPAFAEEAAAEGCEAGKGKDEQKGQAKWEGEKHQTTIRTHVGAGDDAKVVMTGLVLLRLGTSSGSLVIEY